MAGTSKTPSSTRNSGKSNGAALVHVKCGYTVCQFSHDSEVTPPPLHVSHLKYHVRIVGGAIGKALLLFPEARSPSHLVEELLASRMYGFLSIWLLR